MKAVELLHGNVGFGEARYQPAGRAGKHDLPYPASFVISEVL
jgi:hypothetical protein